MGKIKHDPNQMLLDLQFKKKFNSFLEATKEMYEPLEIKKDSEFLEHNDLAACFCVASSIKKSIRQSGYSRAEIVDLINEYFNRTEKGATEEPPACLKPLTISMFDSYLSKPTQYRIPAYYLFAIQSVCNTLDPSKIFVEAMGGEVITSEESQQLTIAKVQDAQRKLKVLEKELKVQAVK